MHIIAITGATADGTTAGAGKDYAAGLLAATRPVLDGGRFVDLAPALRRATQDPDFMTRKLLGQDAVWMNLADPIKEFGRALFGWSVETCWGPSRLRDIPDPGTGIVPRVFFQRSGTEGGRAVDGDIWLRALELRIDRYLRELEEDAQGRVRARKISTLIVADIRFPNEAAWVLDHGGEVWFLDAWSRNSTMDPAHARHVSESHTAALREMATHIIDTSETRETTAEAVSALALAPRIDAR